MEGEQGDDEAARPYRYPAAGAAPEVAGRRVVAPLRLKALLTRDAARSMLPGPEGRMAEALTREQFRRWSESEPRRYERLAGVPVAMSPERVAHARIMSRV